MKEKELKQLERLATQLLQIRNNKNFSEAIHEPTHTLLQKVLNDLSHNTPGLMFVSYITNSKGNLVLYWCWEEKGETVK